jgi:Golgi phosphoprotein 3
VVLLALCSTLGETWNLLKIGYQLKQVRERLAKGLVDKGILRTDKKSFVVFDVATHPLSDISAKNNIVQKVAEALLSRIAPSDSRVVALICAIYAANLLDSAFAKYSNSQKENAYLKADAIMKEYCVSNEGARSIGVTEVMTG